MKAEHERHDEKDHADETVDGDVHPVWNHAYHAGLVVRENGQDEGGDAQSTPRKVEASEAEQGRMLELLRDAKVTVEAHLEGPMLRVRELLELKEGDVLTFDHPIGEPVGGFVNGKRKFAAQIVSTGKKKAFQIE